MLNPQTNQRELAYVVRVDSISEMDADRLECAHVKGWNIVVGKEDFKVGDLAVFFEIDSKLPEKAPFTDMEFLKSKHYKIKSQKIRGVISQGLLMPSTAFGWFYDKDDDCIVVDANPPKDKSRTSSYELAYYEDNFLTEKLEVTYAIPDDNKRKASSQGDKYKSMSSRHKDLAKTNWWRWLYKRDWGKKILFFFFGKKRDSKTGFPKHFPYIHVTDQERCENMPWVIEDKTPFIRTQKCDGSSGTYILERKPFGKFEFYVCSRNVRQLNPEQECFYENNYYWEVAKKYDIENKLKDYLTSNRQLEYVCWQGEICSPGIQKNPHRLSETHFYCFHMIDSVIGKYDIRDAKKIWDKYEMESVPIEDELYIFPDDFEEFKLSADGKYDPIVCEGNPNCDREGFVYYKTTDPNFSFKNVSRAYLLK